MQKTFLVMRQELMSTFSRIPFLVFAFGIPILVILILGIVRLIQSQSPKTPKESTTSQSVSQLETEGFVDHSGLVQIISDDFKDLLIPYETETQAVDALQDGDISAYYVIPGDYLTRGEVEYVYPDGKSFLSDGQQWVIKWILNLNILGGDIDLADQVWNPVWQLNVKEYTDESQGLTASGDDCSRPGVGCESNELIRLIPSLMVVFFFMSFMTSSNMLFSSIGVEKENRTIELLMVSINPHQLLTGKTIALGIAGLTQTTVWLITIYFVFTLGGNTLNLPDGFLFPIGILLWGLLFFIGGFGLYASLMAGAGALVPKMKEAGIANYLAIIPLFIGYAVGLLAPLGGFSESSLLVFMSFFPFTAPVVMIMRLTDGSVPIWQVIISVGILFVTAYYTLRRVAAMFHTQNLLSGQPFSVKRYFRALVNGV